MVKIGSDKQFGIGDGPPAINNSAVTCPALWEMPLCQERFQSLRLMNRAFHSLKGIGVMIFEHHVCYLQWVLEEWVFSSKAKADIIPGEN